MLSKFFGPKWRHRDPQIRLVAVRQLAADDPILLERALIDEAPAVRREILGRITDLECLQKAIQGDSDKDVCECADQRFRKLLCGQTEDAPAVSERMRLLNSISEIALVEHLARHAREVELRRRALDRVQRPGLLAQIALEDEVGALRLAAVERVEQESTLERIVREARKRDKRVARLARERLANIAALKEGPLERSRIVDKLRQLASRGGMDLAGAQGLREQWSRWEEQADSAERAAYKEANTAFEQASADYRATRELRQELILLCERVEGMGEDLRGREALSPEDESTLQALLVMLQSAWDELAVSAAQADALDPNLQERFARAMAASRKRAADLGALRGQVAYLQELLDAMRHLEEIDNGVSRRAIDELKQRWQDAPRLADADGSAGFVRLDEAFRNAGARAEAQLVQGKERKSELKNQLNALFAQLLGSLEEGQLKIAAGRHDQIRHAIAELRRYDRSAASAFEADLRKLGGRLHEMMNWRQFGSHRVREELIEKAEQLAEANAPADVVREAVPAMREQWKSLNHTGSRSSEEEWARFDQACSQAFKVVLEEREQKKQRQAEFLVQRESLCQELEEIGQKWDWQSSDWKSAEKVVSHSRRLWREIGSVDHAAYKRVDERFRKALSVFEEPLAAEREANRKLREGLIEEVEGLITEPNLGSALDLAKAAQRRWKVTVQGHRKREQAMWTSFRTAMDAVFARRDEQRQQQEQHRKQLLVSKQVIINQAADLATAGLGDLPASRRALAELEQQFAELEATGQDQKLREVFDSTRHALAASEKQARQAEAAAAVGKFADKAGLCEQLEALAEQPSDNEAGRDEIVAAWQALETLADQGLESRLQERFASAQAALQHGAGYPADLLQTLLECKRGLILRMEVLKDTPSPEAYAEQRMALKVKLLSEAMASQDADDDFPREWEALQIEWLLCGPVPAAELTELNQRYQRCMEK